jgi:plastocyanin
MKLNKFIVAAVLSFALFTLTACQPTTTESPTGETSEPVDFTIEMSSFEFSPSTIEAEAGSTIKIKLVGEDIDHDFIIDGLDVQSPQLSRGESKIITVTIPSDAAGKSFEFYCGVGSHKESGMVGTLKVK